jgi:uncharacterized tellurite resistance protein B-like protein
VGLLDVLRPGRARLVTGRHAQPSGHGTLPVNAAARPAARPGTPRTPARPASPELPDILDGGLHDGWVPAGVGIEVAGLTLPGGMLYVGKELPARTGDGPDPALIDPRLPVDLRKPSCSGSAVDDSPSYVRMTAQVRGSYLTWLAGGRSDPDAPISWVFLFFYGLERRLIVDAEQGPAVRDRSLVSAEVRRLLDLHCGRSSFDSYATQFLSLIDVLNSKTDLVGAAPPRTSSRWLVPHQLRAGLGRFAVEGRPVPAAWALSWAHFHPGIYPRTPARRCPREFEELFRAGYLARYGEGLRVQPCNTMLWHTYMAANPAIGHIAVPMNLPDVIQLAAPTKQLRLLVEECADALDAYSRYLGRHPDAKDTLAAASLLPPELADDTNGDLLRLMAWVEGRLGLGEQAIVDGSELIALWPGAEPDRLAKAEAAALARLLETRGVGVEPDVRLGGPVLSVGPAVLFRIAPGRPDTPSAAYPAAAALSHLAAAFSAADGHVSDAERARLHARLGSAMDLTEPERVRLHAHTEWLLAGQIRLTGLTTRLAALDQIQRETIADFLAMLAAADSLVSPAEITTLTKIFQLLGLDSASLYSRIHAATTRTAPATEPVIVRPAVPAVPGYAIPQPPGSEAAGTSPLQLDETAIAAKLAETTAVSALLGSIFAEHADRAEPAAPGTVRNEPQAHEPPVARLDAPHSALLRTLAAQDQWTRARLEAECAVLALLPDGALDTLNDAAYETTGDPLTDGEDPIDINHEVAREMLA